MHGFRILLSPQSRRRLVVAGFSLALAATLVGAVAAPYAWSDDDNHRDQHRCQPHRTEQGQQSGKSDKGKLPEFPGTVTTVCVGKHPTDVAVAPGLNLAVVTNRDERTLSVVDIRAMRVVKSVRLPERPLRVAVDGNFAAVVSPWSRTLFLVDLFTVGYPVTSINLGHGSSDVALDATLQLAFVLGKNRSQLSVVNLRTPGSPTMGTLTLSDPANQIKYSPDLGLAFLGSSRERGLLFVVDVTTNPAAPRLLRTKALPNPPGLTGHDKHHDWGHDHDGVNPQGITYNPATGDTIILDRDGSLITYKPGADLFAQPYTVAKGPLWDIAADPVRNLAVVPGQNEDAFIVDLAAQTTVYHVSVGRKPVATAVNGDSTSTSAGTAIVVNQDEDSVSIFAMPNASLRITALAPSSVQAGSGAFTLTIQGTGFANNAVVKFGGTVVPSTFASSNQLTASIPAALVATVGTFPVTVTVGSRTTLPAQFTVSQPSNPTPVIIPPLRPNGVVAGTVPVGSFQLVNIDGVSFLPSSTVSFNGTVVSSQFLSSTQLVMSVPGSLLQTPGTVNVTVTNPAPGGGVASIPFDIKSPVISPGVTTAAVNVGAPSSGIAVDPSGIAVATVPGAFLAAQPTIDDRVVLLTNLTGTLPGNPPVPGTPFAVGWIPEFATVNPNTHVALISNYGGSTGDTTVPGTASLVDMTHGTVAGTITVGVGPQGVATDPNPLAAGTYPQGIGVVGNNLDGTMTVIDLNPNTQNPILATISANDLGYPTGVAINPDTHMAVVADQSNDPGDVVPIDLTNPTAPVVLPRISLGAGYDPNGVAIYRARNLAVVANTSEGQAGTVSVVDLNTNQVIATLPAGLEPFGVAVDETLGIAAVVTRVDATLRFIDLKPTTPTLLSLTLNQPFIPTGVAIVPGISGGLRVLVTDVSDNSVQVVDIGASALQ